MKFVRKISKLDELAAALPDDVKEAYGMMSGPDTDDPTVAPAQELTKTTSKKAHIDAVEKAGLDSMDIDWSQKRPQPITELQAQAAENNPANLNKRIYNYQKRRNYGEAGKQLIKGRTMGWNEEDEKNEKEIEEKYANKPWYDWES